MERNGMANDGDGRGKCPQHKDGMVADTVQALILLCMHKRRNRPDDLTSTPPKQDDTTGCNVKLVIWQPLSDGHDNDLNTHRLSTGQAKLVT